MLKLILLLSLLQICSSQQTNYIDHLSKISSFFEPNWFLDNIPFIELPDKSIEDVYYYRWSTHKRHLRYTTPGAGYIITEFVHAVAYAGKFDTINDAAGHHIFESRWLRNNRYVQDYINFWARNGGNTNAYSEWIAHAAYSSFLVDGDVNFIRAQQNGFVKNFNRWAQNNFEPELGLYFINPLMDAMEYSCSSLPTTDPFGGGVGYRPSFNSEMYGNAMAISKIARLNDDEGTAQEFEEKAKAIKEAILKTLWDKERQFFYHMMRLDNPNLDLLDSREEIGFYPWIYNIPDNTTNHVAPWAQLWDPQGFYSDFVPTTCERRSEYYDGGQPIGVCCWWNGNSWPYSTGLTLNALASLIRNYQVTDEYENYFELLQRYALTQYKDGIPYVAECHSPEQAYWVCDTFNHSEHYAHSTFNDNILSELIGIQPQEDNTLKIHSLAPSNWPYFIAENILYHGHEVTVLYDSDGTHYETGDSGLQIFIDGQLVGIQPDLSPITVEIPPPKKSIVKRITMENYASNPEKFGYPEINVSYTGPNGSPWQVVDGRIFYDYVPSNRWHNWGDQSTNDGWLSIDFGPGRKKVVNSVHAYVYSDVVTGQGGVDCPTKMAVEYFDENSNDWLPVQNQVQNPTTCSPNDLNILSFDDVTTQKVKLVMTGDSEKGYYVGLTEIEIWAKYPSAAENIYEAEDGLIHGAEMLASDEASSGSYVGRIDGSNSNVEFNGVWVDTSDLYEIRIYYANGEENVATHNILINYDETVTATYPPTGEWGIFENFITLQVNLLRGNNVLIFQHAQNFAELDKIEILI